jgi:hypothetical protein
MYVARGGEGLKEAIINIHPLSEHQTIRKCAEAKVPPRYDLSCANTHTHTTSLEAKSRSASSLSWLKGKLLPTPSPPPLFEIEKKKL